MPPQLTVFLCHASQDKALVRDVHSWLTSHGFAPWLDEIDLVPGMDWKIAIRKAICASDIFLALLTENSISKRGFVQAEIRTALDELRNVPTGHIYVVPALLSQCAVPDELTHLHVVDITQESGKQQLLNALQLRATQMGRYHQVSTKEAERKYQELMDAIEYTLAHDDGVSNANLEQADVILIGLSRSGKTPLALYLATQFGIRSANFPLTPDDFERSALPDGLEAYLSKILGLVVSSDYLSSVRSVRRPDTRYASPENCYFECREYARILDRYGISRLDSDLSRVAIEELGSRILHQLRPDRLFY